MTVTFSGSIVHQSGRASASTVALTVSRLPLMRTASRRTLSSVASACWGPVTSTVVGSTRRLPAHTTPPAGTPSTRAATGRRRCPLRSTCSSTVRGLTTRSTEMSAPAGSGRSAAVRARSKRPTPIPASESLTCGSVRRMRRSCLPPPRSSAWTEAGTAPESESESARSTIWIGNETMSVAGRSV